MALVMTPVFFNYGGAAENPTGFLLLMLYWVMGVVSAGCLFTARTWARLLALAWNLPLLGFTILHLDTAHPSKAQRPVLEIFALVSGYLLVTSAIVLAKAYRAAQDPRTVRRRVLWASTAIALALISARVAYSAAHTPRALAAKLDSSSEETRCDAAKELASRGRASAAVLPKLTAMLDTTSCIQSGRDRLPEFIETIGGIDPFLPLIENDSGRAAEKAAGQLSGEHPNPQRRSDLEDAYVDGLHNRDPLVRRTSAAALGDLRWPPARVTPELINALNDPDEQVRIAAVNALSRIRSAVGLDAARASKDTAVRQAAIQLLEEYGVPRR